ncbi:MAG: RidA family protein [Gammaproteobacteria bacterium]
MQMTANILAKWVCTITLALVTGWATAAQPGSVSTTSEALGAMYKQYGASQAVRSGDLLFIGGIVAMADDGSTIAPHDGEKQAEVIYQFIRTLLKKHGATARNVVSETLYIKNYPEYWKGAAVRQKFYDEVGAAYPSTVGFGVVSLSAEDYVFEVQMVVKLADIDDK